MKPQEIKKKYFIEVKNKRYKCVFCKQTYKENVTRMVHIFNLVRKFIRPLIREHQISLVSKN